jgi:hypothetical protein
MHGNGWQNTMSLMTAAYRDCVIPNAGLKYSLTAQPEERRAQRLKELVERALMTTYDDVLRDIMYRIKTMRTHHGAAQAGAGRRTVAHDRKILKGRASYVR